MAAPPVDTSITGYTWGFVNRQDDIYRNRQRVQPYSPAQSDLGYDSAITIQPSSLQASSPPSLLSLANSVKCSELLNNDSNFAPNTAECYESDDCSMSMY